MMSLCVKNENSGIQTAPECFTDVLTTFYHLLLSVPEQTHGNMSDQDRISPYNINTISSRQVMRIKKNINYLKGLLVDPISNSPN